LNQIGDHTVITNGIQAAASWEMSLIKQITRTLRTALIVALPILALGDATAHAGIPSDDLRNSLQHSGDVNDFAGILSPTDRATIAERCRQLREKTGAGFVIVTLQSLEGGQIDDFTVKLFKQWGIGQKDKNNGLLLLVALKDRKARLEVGYGLEPIIPDALAGRILDEQLFPAFKQQRYGDGLKAAVNRAAELIERGEPAPKNLGPPKQPPMTLAQKLVMAAFFSIFVAVGGFLLGLGTGAKVGPLCLFGLFFGGVPFLMGAAIASPVAPLVHAPVALLLFLLGRRAGRNNPGSFRGTGGTRSSRYDPWMWQSFGSGSSGGSSWSGGGFSSDSGSFGGGSSGGGGASGSW